MVQNRKFVVWEWVDKPRNLVYVGWGRDGDTHPAEQLWINREVFTSDLTVWLREFKNAPPEWVDHSGIVHFYRHEACNVAASLRARYKAEGRTILDTRPWGARSGGGAARMIMAPDMSIYSSVRQAAVDKAVNPCTITRWCQSEENNGWTYLD